MRLHSITIENFRAIEHLELTGIPDSGVVLIHGDNEKGKSSILEAIQTILTESHKTSKQAVRGIQPVDRDVAVKIRLELTVGPYRMVISKQFLKTKSAELQIIEPKRANYTGDEAEAQLAEILESHLDRFLLDTLFMRQGEVDAGINAVGIPSLTSALNSQGGPADDAREDTALMVAVEAEYARYFTKTGKKSKRYEVFFTEVEAHRQELDHARASISTLSAQVDRVARLERERDAAQKKLPAAEEELALRRSELDAAAKIKTRAEDVDKRLARARTDHQQALKTFATRVELRLRAEKAQSSLADLNITLAEAIEAAEAEHEETASRAKKLEAARVAEVAAVESVKKARHLVEVLTNDARRTDLSAMLNTIDELDEKIHVLRTQQASEAPVSEHDIEALQKAANDVRVNRALSQARGGSIALSAVSTTEITVDGDNLALDSTAESISLDREVTITVGDVTMVVNPGRAITDSRAELESAEADFAELLDTLDVDGVDHLRQRLEAQHKLGAQIESLLKERVSVIGGAAIDTLRAEHAALSDNVPTNPSEFTLEQARDALNESEAHREKAGEAVQLADAALDGLRGQPADRALTILRTQIEGAEDNVNAANADIERAVAEATDGQLEESAASQLKQLGEIEAEKAEVDALLQKSDPVLAEQLCVGAEANLRSYTEVISTSATELVRLEGHIGIAAGAAERHAKARAALEAAENRLESEQRRALAAERLRQVMIRHREDSRKRYAAPFADKLARLAARVFGEDTNFDLDDQLSIATRSIGQRTVNLDHLSGGAQEQLAILTRFAIADLVADSSSHGAVPVFIDDALGSTDPVRLTRISTLFGEAGRDSQVFVLTCVPERYNYVSPKTVCDIDTLKSTTHLEIPLPGRS